METNFNLNINKIPRELRLIIDILRTEDNEISKANLSEWFNNIDWGLFIDLAVHHRVFPLLPKKFKLIDEGLIPPFVVQTINQTFMMNTFNMLQFSAELEKVCKLFDENKIHLLFLKGPVLGADLYGDVSLRSSGDLDLLISIDDLDKANEILLSHGYEKDEYIQTVLNDWKWRHHHFTYFHPTKEIKIEIHWRLNPGPGKEPNFRELWDRKRKSSLTSYPVYFLGREDLFLFLVSHGARHGWSRLRWILDINQLARQKMNWENLRKLLKKYQYFHIGGQALILASKLLNTPIISEMITLINGELPKRLAQEAIFYLESMINLHNEPLPSDVATFHKRHLYTLMSKKQKFFFILSFLHPYPEDVKTMPLPEKLHFLYFLLRPFLWAWRKTRYHALS